MSIGKNIKTARKNAGLTQKELGERLSVTGTMIAMYETGKRNPKLDTIQKIANALNITLSELVKGEWTSLPIDEIIEDAKTAAATGISDHEIVRFLIDYCGYNALMLKVDGKISMRLRRDDKTYELTENDLVEIENSTCDFFRYKLQEVLKKYTD